MEQQRLYDIAVCFRRAIQEAKYNRAFFDSKDRMNYFPRGCCDDSADLFGYYLQEEHNTFSKQGNGIYRDRNPNNTTNHAFIILEDGTIIDLTADQFAFFSDCPDGVYVGPEISFYSNLDRMPNYDHYDISFDKRLWHDYQAIKKYLL